MKLIISGATGFVGRELVRQGLAHPKVTSVIALARNPVTAPEKLPEGGDPSKLKSVVVKDYDAYPEEVKKEFTGASACIWTVAITPTKSKAYAFEEVKRVCQTSAITGLRAMHEAGTASPFRFIYMSGAAAERDPTKTPKFLAEYSLMRGETETILLDLAKELGGGIEVAAAKPGYITATGDIVRATMAATVRAVSGIPSIDVVDLAAAMLDQVIKGFEKEPLMPDDLIRLAKELPRAP